MKRVLAAIAALSIAMPAVAHAQGILGAVRERQEEAKKNAPPPQAGPREGGRGGQQAAPAPQAAAPQAPAPQAQERGRGRVDPQQAAPAAPAPQPQPNVAQERGRRGGQDNAQVPPRQGGPAGNFAENRDRGRNDNGRDGRNNDRGDRGRDFRNGDSGRDFRNNDRGRDFGRNDRDRGGRFFNFRGRQYAAVRGPAYSYPRGWGYRRWDRGDFLPSVFLASPFYFDYDWLGLPTPPPGTRWVRNGPDAILVNVYNDRILDVIYDAFY
jgi:Ni/Co efflux regulator RcnB